jgi:SH3 domain-binding protein 5 (SH3BP5)
MDAEKQKSVCEIEHQTKAAEYAAIQQRLAFLLKDIPRTINKAKYIQLFLNFFTYKLPYVERNCIFM